MAVMLSVLGVLAAVGDARGESCTLQLKRVAPRNRVTAADYQFQATYPQSFYLQVQDAKAPGQTRVQIAGQEDPQTAFRRIVKKEPAKYACPHPFRGVAKLGTQEFAFVFDAVGAKPEEPAAKPDSKPGKGSGETEKAKPGLLESLGRALTGGAAEPETPAQMIPKAIAYNRLYFDLNHNGDLTDEKVIEAEGAGGMYFSANYAYAQFPPVTVPLQVDGVKFDYTFTMTVNSQAQGAGLVSAWGSLNAGAYREGEITLDGKPHRVVLIDFNSNGRFDDQIKGRDDVATRDGEVYPAFGDVLLVDPETSPAVFVNPYDVTASEHRYLLSKLVDLDGKFYDVLVSPAGDKLTLAPAKLSLGAVTNANDRFTAMVYGEQGFVKIRGGKSQPVPLPAGSWKLLSYTIDQTPSPEPKPEAGEKKDAAGGGTSQTGLLGALAKALGVGDAGMAVSQRPLLTRVSAQATKDYKPVAVRAGATAELPFGPPYKPVVRVDYAQAGQAQLGLQLIGCAGERCTDMSVRGERPPVPQFKISDPKGEVVYQGNFKYG
jgi:hypothetical protein